MVVTKNNQIEFMDFPKCVYGPIKDFYLRNPLKEAVQEKS